MVTYSIDAYRKINEDLLFELEIPKEKIKELARIMEWNEEDENEFSLGIGVYNINKKQAKSLERLIGKEFYSDELTLQLSAGEV